MFIIVKKSWRLSQTFVRVLHALILEWVTRTGFVEWWDAAENFKTASEMKSVVGPCWWACKRRGCLTMLRIFVPLLHARAGALHVFVYSWLGLNPLHIEDCEDRRKGRKIDSMLGLWELSCNARMLMQQTGSHVWYNCKRVASCIFFSFSRSKVPSPKEPGLAIEHGTCTIGLLDTVKNLNWSALLDYLNLAAVLVKEQCYYMRTRSIDTRPSLQLRVQYFRKMGKVRMLWLWN